MICLTLFFNPLEQFEIVALSSIFNTNFSFSLLTHSIFLIFFFGNYYFFNKNIHLNLFIYILYKFVKKTLKDNLNMKSYPHFIYVFYLFIFILLSNLSGMIAYSFTITSAIIVTFFLSSHFFIGANIVNYFYIILNKYV